MTTATTAQTNRTKETAGAESELRAAARRRGLTMKELAALMGVSAGYLSQIANGGRPWTPKMREKAAAVLGEVPGQGTVYRQGGVVTGESSFIRERARTLGMTMQDLADRAGVSYGYMTDVSRGRRHMGVKVQARVESVLQAPAKVAPAQCVNRQGEVVTGESSFIRERARELGMTMQDLAERAGVSYGYMTQVARGRKNMGVKVQARVESALHAPAKIAPAQCANRQGEVVSGESSYIRERARELGMTMQELAERVGVSYGYMSMVARGRQGMGVKVQARDRVGAGGSGEGRSRAASLHRPGGRVGPDERPRDQPERGRTARRHQLRQPLPDHERQEQPVAGRSEEAARRPVPTH